MAFLPRIKCHSFQGRVVESLCCSTYAIITSPRLHARYHIDDIGKERSPTSSACRLVMDKSLCGEVVKQELMKGMDCSWRYAGVPQGLILSKQDHGRGSGNVAQVGSGCKGKVDVFEYGLKRRRETKEEEKKAKQREKMRRKRTKCRGRKRKKIKRIKQHYEMKKKINEDKNV